jgi:hypothetical protein
MYTQRYNSCSALYLQSNHNHLDCYETLRNLPGKTTIANTAEKKQGVIFHRIMIYR